MNYYKNNKIVINILRIIILIFEADALSSPNALQAFFDNSGHKMASL